MLCLFMMYVFFQLLMISFSVYNINSNNKAIISIIFLEVRVDSVERQGSQSSLHLRFIAFPTLTQYHMM